MALNMDAIGKKIGPKRKTYTWKDCALYALGVGAGFDDLEYCYEKDLKVLPSFSIITLYDFLQQLAQQANINLAGILHGEQDLEFHAPIPPEGELVTRAGILDYYDKGKDKGALVVGRLETTDGFGKRLFTGTTTLFARLDGGFGGKNIQKKPVDFPERQPDFTVQNHPSPDQPLLYRLSGDLFPLHVDQRFAEMSGFEKPIMHGLCTHGFACRALIASLCPKRPEEVRRMSCRFTKPLYPGVPVEIRIWKTGEGKAVWKVLNMQTGDVVIDYGEFEYGRPSPGGIRFDGKVAVVTGAGGGLGRVYALEMARRGARVVVNDLGAAKDGTGEASSSFADKVVEEIRSLGGEAVANYDNVANEAGGKKLIQTALDAFGTVDILINNAGILRDKSFLKMTDEDWRAVLDVHLNGACYATRPAFAVMKEKGYGRILFTTSAAGLYGNFGQTNYGSAKMALVGLMNTLKLEGQRYGIRVNTIAPVAASRLTRDIMPPDLLEKLKPEYVAPMALYLVSEECRASGRIYNAAMGSYSRAAVFTGPFVALGDENRVPTVEDLADNMDKIDRMEGAVEFNDAMGAIMDLPSPFADDSAERKEKSDQQPGNIRTFFENLPATFKPEAAEGVEVVFQFHISGDQGGDWYCAVQDQACEIGDGVHGNPTCILKMKDHDFADMISGKTSAIQAFTSGILVIEKDVMKSQLLEKLFSFSV